MRVSCHHHNYIITTLARLRSCIILDVVEESSGVSDHTSSDRTPKTNLDTTTVGGVSHRRRRSSARAMLKGKGGRTEPIQSKPQRRATGSHSKTPPQRLFLLSREHDKKQPHPSIGPTKYERTRYAYRNKTATGHHDSKRAHRRRKNGNGGKQHSVALPSPPLSRPSRSRTVVVGHPTPPPAPPAPLVVPVPLPLAAKGAEVWLVVEHPRSAHELCDGGG